jgi:CRP-like cAMP-binding protein
MAKAWTVGREGMVGISLILGGSARDNWADVQIAGRAFRLPASSLLAEFQRAGALQQLLLRYVLALVTQASQLGLCSHYHLLEQRLCQYLSRLFDQVPGDEVAITHAQFAKLLGVRRVTITQAAGHLQAAGAIEYARGHVRLISREKLEARACLCQAIIRRAFETVLQKGGSAPIRRSQSPASRYSPFASQARPMQTPLRK